MYRMGIELKNKDYNFVFPMDENHSTREPIACYIGQIVYYIKTLTYKIIINLGDTIDVIKELLKDTELVFDNDTCLFQIMNKDGTLYSDHDSRLAFVFTDITL